MEFDLPTIMFYVFAGVLIMSAMAVISARNPVHSVLFLIFCFFNAAGLFVLIGAEYLAMTLVIVYVGAVAVLFLFVVMMLDVSLAEWRAGFLKYLPLGAGVAVIFFVQLAMLFYVTASTQLPKAVPANPAPAAGSSVTNTEALGRLLYTDYIFAFQVSGLILLVAMIGAIVLTLRHREGVKKQAISKQVARKRSDSVTMVKVQPGEGA